MFLIGIKYFQTKNNINMLFFMVGPFINSATVVLGSLSGTWLGHHVPERIRAALPQAFGLFSLAAGCALAARVDSLAVVALTLLLGTVIGEALSLETRIAAGITRLRGGRQAAADDPRAAEFAQQYITVLVLFCASGMGIFGAMNEGITGDPGMLLAKAVLDLFCSMVFATQLGIAVAFIAVPMLVVQTTLFFLAQVVMPLTTPAMLGDFSAMGGVVLLASGLRLTGIRMFAVTNLLPALLLAMPVSALWALLT